MYECPNCGGNLKFDITRQALFCEYCDTTVDPYSIPEGKHAEETAIQQSVAGEPGMEMQNADASGDAGSDEYEVTVFTCTQCGGEIISEDTTAATFCSFCGSATILDSRVSKERRPAHIIPFSKTKEDCKKAYGRMMSRAFFAPKELKDPEHIEKFRGIYMPYWVYSFEKKGPARFNGVKSYRRGDYIYTNHYDLDCEIDEAYKGLTFDASSSFADNLSEAIAPFDLRQGKEFTPTFLSGFYADTSDVDQKVYEFDAEEMVTGDAGERLSNAPGCSRYGVTPSIVRDAVQPTKKSSVLAMFPVWFLSYRNGDRVSYAVVNGQTGKAAAEIPVDPKKFVAGSALLTIPLFILLNLMFTLKPTVVLAIAVILAIISIMISSRQISGLKIRRSMEDDKGFVSVQPLEEDLADLMADGREHAGGGNPYGRKKLPKSKVPGGLIVTAFGMTAMIILEVLVRLIVRGAMTGDSDEVLHMTEMLGNVMKGAATIGLVAPIIFYVAMFSHIVKTCKGKEKKEKAGAYQKATFKEKLPTIWKPIAGIVAAVLILIINPVSDWFYYIGVILCLVMVMLAFMDIIKNHNELTTRKLPQFNRRGGDENA